MPFLTEFDRVKKAFSEHHFRVKKGTKTKSETTVKKGTTSKKGIGGVCYFVKTPSWWVVFSPRTGKSKVESRHASRFGHSKFDIVGVVITDPRVQKVFNNFFLKFWENMQDNLICAQGYVSVKKRTF